MSPSLFFGVAILLMFALGYYFPGPTVVTPPWPFVGMILMLAGVAISGWASTAFARADQAFKAGRAKSALATDGPYRFSRNPLYLGMIISLCGLALMMAVRTPWIVPPLFAVAMDLLFVRPEEKQLGASLGRAYRDYCAKVRRWV